MTERWTLVAGTLVLWGVLASPLAWVQFPELVDFPGHLVRHELVQGLANDAVLRDIYEVHWRLIPNLAGDLLILPLQALMPTNAAARLMLALGMLGWLVAPQLVHRALWGHWSMWPLTAGVVVYNATLYMGFENFYLTVPLAMGVFAWWVASEEQALAPRLLGLAAAAMVVWTGHLVAWGVLALCITGWQLGVPGEWRERGWHVLMAWLAFLPGALGFLVPQLLEPARIGRITNWSGQGLQKLGVLLAPVLQYEPAVDLSHLLVVLPALFVLPFGFGELRVHPRMAPVLGLLAVVALAMPTQLSGIHYMDQRVPCVLVPLALAATRVALPRWTAAVVVALVVGAVGARVGHLIPRWSAHDARVAELLDVTARVLRPGDRVLPGGGFRLPTVHVADGLVPRASVYMPSLFTGAQLLQVRPELDEINHPAAVPVDAATLEQAATETGDYASSPHIHGLDYLRRWPQHFDVLVWMADTEPPREVALSQVAEGTWFRVYRIGGHDAPSSSLGGSR